MTIDVEVEVLPRTPGPLVTCERTEHGVTVVEAAGGQKFARLQFHQVLDTLTDGVAGTEERDFVTMLDMADIDQLFAALRECRNEMRGAVGHTGVYL